MAMYSSSLGTSKCSLCTPLVSPRLAETLAREIGASTLPLDPIEGVSRERAAAGTGYVELMEANLASLRTGLGCS